MIEHWRIFRACCYTPVPLSIPVLGYIDPYLPKEKREERVEEVVVYGLERVGGDSSEEAYQERSFDIQEALCRNDVIRVRFRQKGGRQINRGHKNGAADLSGMCYTEFKKKMRKS